LERIVNSSDVQQAATGIGPAVAEFRQIIGKIDAETGPLLNNIDGAAQAATATLREAQAAIDSIQRTIGSGSALTNDAESLMQELTRAARSIRVFADYLERNPQALIRGKTGGAGQ
jgi:paraquat-inducible protein B